MNKSLIFNSLEEIKDISKVLSNYSRLILLQTLKTNENGLNLKKIHDLSSHLTEIEYKETTYNYLKKLVNSGLVKKKIIENNEVIYELIFDEIIISIESSNK
jgi:Fe2+ or Zn2+ uptake regulation protein